MIELQGRAASKRFGARFPSFARAFRLEKISTKIARGESKRTRGVLARLLRKPPRENSSLGDPLKAPLADGRRDAKSTNASCASNHAIPIRHPRLALPFTRVGATKIFPPMKRHWKTSVGTKRRVHSEKTSLASFTYSHMFVLL